jgi:CheY-like chemotaxis protein
MGYKSDLAKNGKVALDSLRTRPAKYCVVLLDIMMPVMDGWDFLKERRADAAISSIPVIVLTAILEGPPKDAVAFLQKPIDLVKLDETLREYC